MVWPFFEGNQRFKKCSAHIKKVSLWESSRAQTEKPTLQNVILVDPRACFLLGPLFACNLVNLPKQTRTFRDHIFPDYEEHLLRNAGF
jgi:hypothetical protein